MTRNLLKQPLFVIGFLFICVFFISSLTYSFVTHDFVPKKMLFYNHQGKLIDSAPLSPSQAPPLGNDTRGYSIAAMILIGAKTTISIAVCITVIRMLLGSVLGWLYGMYFYRFKRIVTGMLEGIHYMPMTLLAYLVLSSILIAQKDYGNFQYSKVEREWFEIFILALIAVPIVATQIGDMIGETRKSEFINSSIVLGAGKWHLFWRDILPHLTPRFILFNVQQMIQVLVILVHLGVLNLFFGGTIVLGPSYEYFSTSNEWSGLLGLNVNYLMTMDKWLFIYPVIVFSLTILAFSFMSEGIKKAIEMPVVPRRKRKLNEEKEDLAEQIYANSFEPLQLNK
jgi:peptide/nickel transport system permease protein